MNITNTPPINTLINSVPNTTSSTAKSSSLPLASVVVNFSERAQQLNRSDAQTNTPERSAPIPTDKIEPTGIQFIEGYDKGGKARAVA